MALEVRALKRSYGAFSVSLDLSVDSGETLALVGPSGSGKTTVLNLIAGLAEPESGKVLIDGEDITGLPSWKRNISVVFQDLALFPHLDVGGNIAYGLFIRKVPGKERRRIVEETLNIVRLPGYASRRIDTLSGGERQRVAIARSLAASPRALLLDEPFSSLDAPLRKAMRREFLEIRSHSNAPCVFVTHDREEAVMLGDRVALMVGGRIIETGTGRSLFLEPKTEIAARFFGAGQVVPCQVSPCGLSEKRGGGTGVNSPLGVLTVPPGSEYNPSSPRLFIPRDAVFVDTPEGEPRFSETIAARTGEPGGAELKSFSARVSGTLFEGQALILKLLLPHSPELTAFEVSASPRMKPPAQGSLITLRLDQNLIRFVK